MGWGRGDEPGVGTRVNVGALHVALICPTPFRTQGAGSTRCVRWCRMRLSSRAVRVAWLRFRGVVHRSSFRRSASGFTFAAVTISGANANKPTSITVSDIDGDGQLGA